jgi:hypothetical protein
MFIAGKNDHKIASKCPIFVAKSCHHLMVAYRKYMQQKKNHSLKFKAIAK